MAVSRDDKLKAEKFLQNGVKALGLEPHKVGNLYQFDNKPNIYFYTVNGNTFKKDGMTVAFASDQVAYYANQQRVIDHNNAPNKSEAIERRERSGHKNLEPYKADDAGYINKGGFDRAKKIAPPQNEASVKEVQTTTQWQRATPTRK